MNATTSPRRRARELVLRILYEADLSTEPVSSVVEATLSSVNERASVRRFARALALAVEERRQEIDDRLRATTANWSLERMASVDRNILRAAIAELLVFEETDARVVIDEAVSIARRFGTDDSGRFVNGILDKIARELRPEEFGGANA